MYINRDIAESIVTETMKIIHRNVNLMNERGVIIASGDKERIDTYHEGASIVIKTGKTLEIDIPTAQKLEGTKPGINMPIEIDGKIAGVVGVTGPPDEIRSYTRLVKMTVELMIKQNILTKEIRLSSLAKERFLNDLLNGYFEEAEEAMIYRGRVLGFDLTLPRIAIVIAIRGDSQKGKNTVLSEEAEREQFIKDIKGFTRNSSDIVGSNIRNNYFILKHIDPSKDEKAGIIHYLSRIKSYIEGIRKASVKAGIGKYHQGIHGIHISYQEALKALHIGEIFNNSADIYFIDELVFEELLTNIPTHIQKNFITETLKGLEGKEHLIQTLTAFFNNGFNICKTAKAAHLHRNTVNNHLRKILTLTGKDPLNFYDAVQLYLAIVFNQSS